MIYSYVLRVQKAFSLAEWTTKIPGFILTMASLYVLLNLGIDVLYGVIDPRARIEA